MHVFVTSQSYQSRAWGLFSSLTVVLKHQVYFTNVLVLESLTYTTRYSTRTKKLFFYFLKWQQFSQSISYLMRISSANLVHLGPPSTACAVLHPYILLATYAFPLWTAFRHPLTSSPPQVAVFQTYLYLISQCTGGQHFWLFTLITNTAFLTSHTTILRQRMWKKFSSAEGLNSQVRSMRKKMPSFCSRNL